MADSSDSGAGSGASGWIGALLAAGCYSHPVAGLQLLETHISWVILTGPFAYKIKKPVDLGFLDFSTLQRRRHCAEEEVRLNRRLAPGIYLEVVPITGSPDEPRMDGSGTAFEYAVKMVQFPQEAQLDRVLESAGLHAGLIDSFAGLIADFHASVPVASPEDPYGTPEAVYGPVEETFRHIREFPLAPEVLERLRAVEEFSRRTWQTLRSAFDARRLQGFVRECHGDLHLRNLAWIDGRPVAFDCIEFNPELRWIDVLSDVAFLVMDLRDRQQAGLARRFLDVYLSRTGDYERLGVLPFYLTYRALVRAKVTAIRLGQSGLEPAERKTVEAELGEYLELAHGFASSGPPRLILTCGMSGSGKTTVTGALLEQCDAIRIRSDVERKRLHGLAATESGRSPVGEGIYDEASFELTYARLRELAEAILDAGMSVIVDAASLEPAHREPFRRLAARRGVDYVVLEVSAPRAVLEQRLRDRRGDASDADMSVLAAQLEAWEGFGVQERAWVLTVDTSQPLDAAALAERISAVAHVPS